MKKSKDKSSQNSKGRIGILEKLEDYSASFLLILLAFQVLKKVYLAPTKEDNYPAEKIKEEVKNIEVSVAPQPQWWLRDTTVLSEVNQVVFDPADILGENNNYLARKGIPEDLSGEQPRIDDLRGDLCPSRALSEDAMGQLDKILALINKFEIDTVVYYYQIVKPIGESAQDISCSCRTCIRTIEERFDLKTSILDSFKEALAGKSSKSWEEVWEEYNSDLQSGDDEIKDTAIQYKRRINEIDEERKEVFQKMEEFFTHQSKLIREFNRKVIEKIADTTGASLKIVQPMMDGYHALGKELKIREYAQMMGFSPELLNELEVECIYGRSISCGGEIIGEFPKDKRGLYIFAGDEDDTFNRRFISQSMEGEEAFVFPEEDVDSLMTVLKSLEVWSDGGDDE